MEEDEDDHKFEARLGYTVKFEASLDYTVRLAQKTKRCKGNQNRVATVYKQVLVEVAPSCPPCLVRSRDGAQGTEGTYPGMAEHFRCCCSFLHIQADPSTSHPSRWTEAQRPD